MVTDTRLPTTLMGWRRCRQFQYSFIGDDIHSLPGRFIISEPPLFINQSAAFDSEFDLEIFFTLIQTDQNLLPNVETRNCGEDQVRHLPHRRDRDRNRGSRRPRAVHPRLQTCGRALVEWWVLRVDRSLHGMAGARSAFVNIAPKLSEGKILIENCKILFQAIIIFFLRISLNFLQNQFLKYIFLTLSKIK